jgi:hypothetical protein
MEQTVLEVCLSKLELGELVVSVPEPDQTGREVCAPKMEQTELKVCSQTSKDMAGSVGSQNEADWV